MTTLNELLKEGRNYYFPAYGELDNDLELMYYIGLKESQFGKKHEFLWSDGILIKVIYVKEGRIITDGVVAVPIPFEDNKTHAILNLTNVNDNTTPRYIIDLAYKLSLELTEPGL